VKNLCVFVSALCLFLSACQEDPAPEPNARSSDNPSIEPADPSQEPAPDQGRTDCGTPTDYGDLGDRSLAPALVQIDGSRGQAMVPVPLSGRGEETDLLLLSLVGGKSGIADIPGAGTYEFPEEPFAESTGLQSAILADLDRDGIPRAAYAATSGKLVIETADILPGVTPKQSLAGRLENVTYKQFSADNRGPFFVEGGCQTHIENLSFAVDVVLEMAAPPEPPPAPEGEIVIPEGEPLLPGPADEGELPAPGPDSPPIVPTDPPGGGEGPSTGESL
jgi:hypothetical protein